MSLTKSGGTIEIDGARVAAVEGTAPEGTLMTAAFKEADLPLGLDASFEAVSKPLSIKLGDGMQPEKPLRVTFPVDPGSVNGFDSSNPALGILIMTEGQEKPDFALATWNDNDKTATAWLPHLTDVQLVFFNLKQWISGINSTIQQSAGLEYPKPNCTDKSVKIGYETYTAQSDAQEWTCVRESSGSLVVTAHSNSPLPFMVTSEPRRPGRTVTDVSRSGIITAALGNQLLSLTGSGGSAVMFPGGATEFIFDKPVEGISLKFKMLPNIALLAILTQTLDALFNKFGQKLHLDKLSSLECWKNILDTSMHPDISSESVSSFVKTTFSCIGEFADLTAVGRAIVVLVSAAPAAFASMFIGLLQTLNGQANFSTAVGYDIELLTFSDPKMGISFKYPANWVVTKPTDPRDQTGAKIFNQKGAEIAQVNFGTAFDFQPCARKKPYKLIDTTQTGPIPGMDTSTAPTSIKVETVDVGSESAYYPDKQPIRLGISLYSGPGQVTGTTSVCNLAAFFQAGGKFGFFSAGLGFQSNEAVVAYTKQSEYFQIRAMLASLRFL
ncbi:hypothetical protein [Paenarthrobacter sp. NPDC091669]|uniref:hypothetical protein n=1 Tax=Paenarthrobacter sp. NPDC091669 TaxID=3364384 RepID=UPI003816E6DE